MTEEHFWGVHRHRPGPVQLNLPFDPAAGDLDVGGHGQTLTGDGIGFAGQAGLSAAEDWPATCSSMLIHWFWFLIDPAIDATNRRGEQAIRPAVANRKVMGGNRTWLGA